MLLACFSAGGPGHLVQIHDIMDSIEDQQVTNLNLTASVRNLIMGRGWIFHQDNNPKLTSKSTQKWVTEHKINLLPWPSQSSDLNPEENEWVNWREEAPTWSWYSEGSGEILYEGMVSDLLSSVLQTHRRKLRTVILGKGRCNNWVPIIVANMN